MKAIWKGRITFGGVNVPVKLYTAVNDFRTHYHLLHDRDQQRLEQRLFCAARDTVVNRSDTVRGFEIRKGEYVLVEHEELEKFEPEKSTTIEITEFVEAREVDSRYIEKAYYLGPDIDKQVFVNLLESLKETNLAGVCRWSMRKESYCGLLEAGERTLELVVHRSADQVIPEDSFKIETVEVSAKERSIAARLIAELGGEFNPQDYHDEYQAKLRDLIDRKARGNIVKFPAARKQKITSDNELLHALEKSVKSLGKR